MGTQLGLLLAGSPASIGLPSTSKETTVKLYNVRTRTSQEVPLSALAKTMITQRTGRQVYAVTSQQTEARLFKFVSKAEYEALPVPEVGVPKPS